MNDILRSKWTSIVKLNGYRHYEIKNVFIKEKTVEMFSICQNKIRVKISLEELKDQSKWVSGWARANNKK
ncbi:MAG: TIGR02450 family Trp-rich protein [bacterium TMED46]|nr:MAG: TIGR02450 family Trp-rich protein [bacterium TMED46]|tara:strand:- start:498 stop:707 length:210 start_codon:yes stop_codon:yes gene_type:complete